MSNSDLDLDSLLVPEKHVSDFSNDDLYIDILPCGFSSLDAHLFLKRNRGELIIVAGRPGSGKSAFMTQLGLNVSKHSPVILYSLEMDKAALDTRLIASILNTATKNIQVRNVSEASINKAREELKQFQLFIDDRSTSDIHILCNEIREVHKRKKVELVVLDYLQLLRTADGGTRDVQIGTITRSLKLLAMDLKIPIVVGCQLSRATEKRGFETGNFKPLLSDLRESGNIEQDADMVLFVHREYIYNRERHGEADILISKHRNGGLADINMRFIETQTKFIDDVI